MPPFGPNINNLAPISRRPGPIKVCKNIVFLSIFVDFLDFQQTCKKIHLETPRGPNLPRPGSNSAPTWPSLAPTWPHFSPNLAPTWAKLAPSWDQVGPTLPTWPQLDAILAQLCPSLAHFGSNWPYLASIWPQLGPNLDPTWPDLVPILVLCKSPTGQS